MDKRTRYGNMINEGGEGYNPHDRRNASMEPEWSVLSGKIDRLRRIMESISTEDRRYAKMEAEIARLTMLYNGQTE